MSLLSLLLKPLLDNSKKYLFKRVNFEICLSISSLFLVLCFSFFKPLEKVDSSIFSHKQETL